MGQLLSEPIWTQWIGCSKVQLLKNDYFNQKDYQKALEETFLKMDDLMLADQGKIAQRSQNIICSANVSLIVGNNIYVANAGHSRAILYRDVIIFDLSIDHTANNQNEQPRLQQAGYPNIDGKTDLFGEIFITRGLGHFYQKNNKSKGKLEQLVISEPEIRKTQIMNGDKFLMMGTHGLFQTLSNNQILAFINDKINEKQITQEILAQTVEQLLDRLLAPDQKQPGINNMTAILIFFKNQ